jgi:hypothetical protein
MCPLLDGRAAVAPMPTRGEIGKVWPRPRPSSTVQSITRAALSAAQVPTSRAMRWTVTSDPILTIIRPAEFAPASKRALSRPAEAVWKLGGHSLLGRNFSQFADLGSDLSHVAFLMRLRAWEQRWRAPYRRLQRVFAGITPG